MGVLLLNDLTEMLCNVTWSIEELEKTLLLFIENKKLAFKAIAVPLRLALTGRESSPGVYDIMIVIGKQESLKRLNHFILENKSDG